MTTSRCLNIFHTKNVMSITFSQQIISSRLLQVVIGGQKNSFIGKFKLEPIIIYHLGFDLLRKYCEKYCGCSASFFTIPLFLVVVSSSMIFYYFILTYKKLTFQQL